MDEMREIVTVEQVNALFLALAVGGPILGLLIGALVGARRGQAGRGTMSGLLIGLLGALNLALWKLYNALTDRMGLDTVKNLLVNLALFVGLGVVAGLIWGYLASRRDEAAPVGTGVAGPQPGLEAGAARRPEEPNTPPRDACNTEGLTVEDPNAHP